LIVRDRAPDFESLQNKDLFAARCKELGLSSVRLVAEFSDGRPIGGTCLPPRDLFSKPVNLFSGSGASAWRYDQGQECFFNVLTEQSFGPEALRDHFSELSRTMRIVVQERLRNHPTLLPLTNGALSTLRLVTCTTPSGSIDLMPAVIRMPVGRAIVDSFAQGGLAAPIELATGAICGPAVQRDYYGLGLRPVDKHPDSGRAFLGFVIPRWAEVLELARRAHAHFPSVHFVGWDIAVLQEGPSLVEANAIFNPDLTILPHRLSLSDTQFIPYYNYHWYKSANRDERDSSGSRG
jgi:hypothetical protein